MVRVVREAVLLRNFKASTHTQMMVTSGTFQEEGALAMAETVMEAMEEEVVTVGVGMVVVLVATVEV